ncbi:unnamed protein product [Zymoseptoria tritici ST99CH_3D1]|nr:unnamed protein product [Zymoseptoria tritici ST99CH_3D1]
MRPGETGMPADVGPGLAHRASETAAQLKAAEYHINADKAISRHEALLGCFDAAVNFVQYTGLLTVPLDQGPITWPKDQQVRGRQLHERLVSAYGIGCFPCRVVTSISANFSRWILPLDQAQAAIIGDPNLYDAWLFLFGLKLWRIHGSRLTRNCLTNLPIPANRTLPTQDECIAARADHFNRNVITSMAHIAFLSHISPIANEAMAPDAALRDPRRMAYRLHTDKYFAGWVSYFYDAAPETAGLETMPPPTVPESIASVTMMRARDAREHPNETARLKVISHKLRDHTHLAIVIMIWRDFLIPAASNGLMEIIDRYYKKLRLATKGVNPDNMEDEGWEEPVSDDDEEVHVGHGLTSYQIRLRPTC